jgi:glycosyltransferase involved in cell wall biosynthesis
VRKIHLWCPSLRAEDGGIEAYSFGLARALIQVVGEKNITVLVRNHKGADVRAALGAGIRHAATGSLPRWTWTISFALVVIWRALLERPDLIITTHLNFAPFALLVNKLAKIPFWVSLHGYEAWNIQRPSQRRAVATADLLLSVSAFTRDRVMGNYGVPTERMHLLHDTFEPDRFMIGPKPQSLLTRHGLAENDRVILTVGRLSAAEGYKGHDRLIRALARIQVKVPMVKYVIVGGGDDQPRLERIAREQKVANAIIFAGRVGHDELPDYYRLCDLYAMPSTGEGFGIVFLEALAAGKPVLAGNCDGAVDALAGGELGVLIDPNDETALAETAAALLLRTHSHPLVNQPGQLRARAIERFGPDRFKEAVAALLRAKAK